MERRAGEWRARGGKGTYRVDVAAGCRQAFFSKSLARFSFLMRRERRRGPVCEWSVIRTEPQGGADERRNAIARPSV